MRWSPLDLTMWIAVGQAPDGVSLSAESRASLGTPEARNRLANMLQSHNTLPSESEADMRNVIRKAVARLLSASQSDPSLHPLRFPSPPPFPLHLQVYQLISLFILDRLQAPPGPLQHPLLIKYINTIVSFLTVVLRLGFRLHEDPRTTSTRYSELSLELKEVVRELMRRIDSQSFDVIKAGLSKGEGAPSFDASGSSDLSSDSESELSTLDVETCAFGAFFMFHTLGLSIYLH